jgi:hypothetical protein
MILFVYMAGFALTVVNANALEGEAMTQGFLLSAIILCMAILVMLLFFFICLPWA